MKKLISLITIFMLVFAVSCSKTNDEFVSQENENLFGNSIIPVQYPNELWGFYNGSGEEVTGPTYSFVSRDFYSGYYTAVEPDTEKKSLIDKEGNILMTDSDSLDLKMFKNGVQTYIKDGTIYGVKSFIDDFVYESSEYSDMISFGGQYIVVSDGTYMGVIDKEGNIVIDLEHDFIYPVYNEEYVLALWTLKTNDLISISDLEGNLVTEETFTYVDYMLSGDGLVVEKDMKYNILDISTGDKSSLNAIMRISANASRIYHRNAIYVNNKICLIDELGNILYSTKNVYLDATQYYSYARLSSSNMSVFRFAGKETDEQVILDYNGNVLATSTRSDMIYSFNELYYVIRNNEGQYAIKSYEGKTILDYQSNMAYLTPNQDVFFLQTSNSTISMYDTLGDLIKEIPDIWGSPLYSENLFAFMSTQDSEYYIFDDSGNEVFETPYMLPSGEFQVYGDGYIIVMYNDLYGVIDLEGNIILPFEFKQIGLPY